MNCENNNCGGRDGGGGGGGEREVNNCQGKHNGTPLYGQPLNTDTPILWTVSFVPTKSSSIFSKIYPLNTDTS